MKNIVKLRKSCKVIKRRNFIPAVILLLFLIWLIYTNVMIGVTSVKLSYNELPASFDGFKIVQVSDSHNAQFGKDNKPGTFSEV